jgi:hypothetical protein
VAAGSLPAEWKPEVTRMVDQVTTQLGGKPLQPLKQATEEEPGSSDDRLSRLEDLPSPMPPHQENATQDESSSEGGPRSRRGGRNAVGQKA